MLNHKTQTRVPLAEELLPLMTSSIVCCYVTLVPVRVQSMNDKTTDYKLQLLVNYLCS